jgi:hypothetical protein
MGQRRPWLGRCCLTWAFELERMTGIEPAYSAWEPARQRPTAVDTLDALWLTASSRPSSSLVAERNFGFELDRQVEGKLCHPDGGARVTSRFISP